jgi:hypothetical protein
LVGRVAAITGLGSLVDHGADTRLVGGIDDDALFVEYPNLLDAFLLSYGIDDLVNAFPAVEQHIGLGAALDHLTQLIGVMFDLQDIGSLI